MCIRDSISTNDAALWSLDAIYMQEVIPVDGDKLCEDYRLVGDYTDSTRCLYSLQLYYLGYGGNHNSTTRFRRYDGDESGITNPKARPAILKERCV